MSTRYRRGRVYRARRTRVHPLTLALLALGCLVALDVASWVAWALWHLLPLVAGLGLVVLAYRAGQRRPVPPSSPPKVIQGRAEDGEVIQLRAEVEALRAERDEARESARAAWDASTGPAPRAAPSARARLLSDRLSGVHDLFGGGQ